MPNPSSSPLTRPWVLEGPLLCSGPSERSYEGRGKRFPQRTLQHNYIIIILLLYKYTPYQLFSTRRAVADIFISKGAQEFKCIKFKLWWLIPVSSYIWAFCRYKLTSVFWFSSLLFLILFCRSSLVCLTLYFLSWWVPPVPCYLFSWRRIYGLVFCLYQFIASPLCRRPSVSLCVLLPGVSDSRVWPRPASAHRKPCGVFYALNKYCWTVIMEEIRELFGSSIHYLCDQQQKQEQVRLRSLLKESGRQIPRKDKELTPLTSTECVFPKVWSIHRSYSRATLVHWLFLHPHEHMNTVVNYDSIQDTTSCCPKYQQMWINPLLKIVPNKYFLPFELFVKNYSE